MAIMGENSTLLQPLISQEEMEKINFYFLIPANVLTTIMGVFSNFASIVIFAKMNPVDTMTMSLGALALSDFLFSSFNLAYYLITALLMSGINVVFHVDLYSLLFVGFVWQRPLFHKITTLITTFVSCERSLCVVKPFLVRRIFTKRRSFIVLISLYVIPTAFFTLVFANGKLVKSYMNNNTKAVFVAYFTPARATAEAVVQFTAGFPLVASSQVIITIAAVLMTLSLKRSQKFRLKSTAVDTDINRGQSDSVRLQSSISKENSLADENVDNVATTSSAVNQTISSIKQGTRAEDRKTEASSLRENRLMKTVLILAVMHIITNTPMLVYYIYYQVETRFRLTNYQFRNFYLLTADLSNILQALNTLLNIFVYLTLNTKYRILFKRIFLCSPPVDGKTK